MGYTAIVARDYEQYRRYLRDKQLPQVETRYVDNCHQFRGLRPDRILCIGRPRNDGLRSEFWIEWADYFKSRGIPVEVEDYET